MIIYEYDENGFLKAAIESSEDIIVSHNQTTKEPPFEVGKLAKWNGESWELVEKQPEPKESVPFENPIERLEKQLKALQLQSEQTESVLQELIVDSYS